MASPIVLEHQCLLGLREKVVKLALLANLAGLGLFSFSLLVVIFYTMYSYHLRWYLYNYQNIWFATAHLASEFYQR